MDEAKEALQAASKALTHASTELWAEMRPLDHAGWDDARKLTYGRATLTKVMDKLRATVQPPILVVWAELASGELRSSTGARLALGGFLLASELADGSFKLGDRFTERTDKTITALLQLAGDQLGASLSWFDSPQLAKDADSEDGGLIGARPSAGPGFHDPGAARRERVQEMLNQRALAFAATVATEPPETEMPPGSASAGTGSESEIPRPYDDLREPWFRRMFRRARPDAGSQ